MPRKKRQETIGMAALGIGAIALALALSKGGSQEKVVNQYDVLPGFAFPGFNLSIPGNLGGGGTPFTQNILNSFPSPDTSGIGETIQSATSGLSNFKTPATSGIDFDPFITKNALTPPELPPAGILPFVFGGGKVGVLESLNESIFAGGKTFIQSSSPETAIAGVTATQALGLDVAKTGANLINKAGSLETGLAGPLAKGGAIGAGTVLGAAGLGIAGYTTFASAAALKEQNTPSSAAAFGASAGLLGFEGLSLAGAFTGPAAGATGLAGLAVGGAFLGAGLAGVGLGLGVNQVLIDAGIQKPSAVASGPITPYTQNQAFLKANPGVTITGTQTPDITEGDFEANVEVSTGQPMFKSGGSGPTNTIKFKGSSLSQFAQQAKFNQAFSNLFGSSFNKPSPATSQYKSVFVGAK